MEVQLHSFLTSALDGCVCSISHLRPVYARIMRHHPHRPSAHWIGAVWVSDPVFIIYGREKSHAPAGNRTTILTN